MHQVKMNQPHKAAQKKKAPGIQTKPSLYQRYTRLPLKWKLYIWGSTFAVAWLADSISEKIFQQNMIDAEAERRVDIQMEKEKMKEVGKDGKL